MQREAAEADRRAHSGGNAGQGPWREFGQYYMRWKWNSPRHALVQCNSMLLLDPSKIWQELSNSVIHLLRPAKN